MSDPVSKPSSTPDVAADRRTNEVLRALVNEMLERVREMSRRTDTWTPDERAQAEAELETIMARVRREAAHPRHEK
jgi:hypothetical protein